MGLVVGSGAFLSASSAWTSASRGNQGFLLPSDQIKRAPENLRPVMSGSTVRFKFCQVSLKPSYNLKKL